MMGLIPCQQKTVGFIPLAEWKLSMGQAPREGTAITVSPGHPRCPRGSPEDGEPWADTEGPGYAGRRQ